MTDVWTSGDVGTGCCAMWMGCCTWTRGRHTRGRGFTADCEKYAEAALQGWTVLRFTRQQIESGYALECAEKALGLEETL